MKTINKLICVLLFAILILLLGMLSSWKNYGEYAEQITFYVFLFVPVLLLALLPLIFIVYKYMRITAERKLAEETAKKEFERAKIMLDTIPICCCLITKDYKCFDCNRETIRLYEFGSKQEFIDRFYYILPEYQPDGRNSFEAAAMYINKAFEEGACTFEWVNQLADGTPIPTINTLVRVSYYDDPVVLSYSQDLREQKAALDKIERAKIAKEASQAQSRFLATISHEIRTPMNCIMGFTELALSRAVEPQVKDFLGKIADSARRLMNIINDILDISKIESGKMDLEHVPFDLHDTISRCQSAILPSAKEKNIDLRVYAEAPIGKKLLGDPVRLYQVLISLLSNAVKFTNAGTVKLSSSVKKADGPNTTVYFEINDSGIGISPAQIEKIFKPFIQADPDTTRNYGGTGLGLAIAKNIVELMGGKLEVESLPGTGSTFSFEITFETMDASDDMSPSAKSELLEKPHFNGLVLICDDNSMNQQVICEHLARVGLRTVTAKNGKIGVEMVSERIQKGEKPFDLIFMDMFMPVMDGNEAASKITALGTGIPIVAMTANIIASELENYRKHGMPDCLGKPFTSQELWRILLKYLTPVSSYAIDEYEQTQDKDDLQMKLRANFIKSNQTKYAEITEAVAAGDVGLAHRLAHNLKGHAGLIGKTGLQNAAEEVEALLKYGTALIWDSKMNLLKTELMSVLYELRPLFDLNAPAEREGIEPVNAEQILALFEKLEPMLENINPECVNMLDDIRTVPGTEELACQIEDYDFKTAAETLAELKKKWV